MKKSIIAFAIVLLLIAAVPFIGNKLAEDILKQRVELLDSYGVEAIVQTTDSSYLETKKHYEFLIKDEKKFILYLNQFAEKQLPPYMNALVKGVTVGVDAQYSNLPLSDGILVDIYPLTLSTELMSEIQKEDLKFSEYLEAFLHSKGVLYHINYNIVKNSFDGYIKDIQEKYISDDKTEMKLTLLKAKYRGKGPIIAPTYLFSTIDTIEIELSQESELLHFSLKDFQSDAKFETKSNYISNASVGVLSMKVENLGKDIHLNAEKLSMQATSSTQAKSARLSIKNRLKNFTVLSPTFDINTTNFNYDVTFSDIDKEALEELMQLLSLKNEQYLDEKFQNTALKLLAQGVKIDIEDFSLENIRLNKNENLEGFSLKLAMLLKKDLDFANKVKSSPMLLISNIDINMKLKLSKQIFKLLTEINPMLFLAKNYAKEEANSLVFETTFVNGEFRVNGKAVQ